MKILICLDCDGTLFTTESLIPPVRVAQRPIPCLAWKRSKRLALNSWLDVGGSLSYPAADHGVVAMCDTYCPDL
jgi:hypothetical protein